MSDRAHRTIDDLLGDARNIISQAVSEFRPTHMASMVSGGKDSAASHAVATELGIKIDIIIHGRTGCGIPETTEYVTNYYGKIGPDFAVADAGNAYEKYLLRKGFFGKGRGAHGYSYRILKAGPFRKVVSKHIRKRRRGIRILLLNGARKDESKNRKKTLKICRSDPGAPGNIWVNPIHNWSELDRDFYLESRRVPINPVAIQLCRSGECMCGTMQSKGERAEAAAIYPEWGKWLDALENEIIRLHGFGWGARYPRKRDFSQLNLFHQPMCNGCGNVRKSK